jgi:hypothetical protein
MDINKDIVAPPGAFGFLVMRLAERGPEHESKSTLVAEAREQLLIRYKNATIMQAAWTEIVWAFGDRKR